MIIIAFIIAFLVGLELGIRAGIWIMRREWQRHFILIPREKR